MDSIFIQKFKIIAYLLIYIMNTKKQSKDLNKSEILKIRISKEQKEIIERNAKEENVSVSTYVRNECMKNTTHLLKQIPECIQLWDLCNDIYHTIEKYHNEELSTDIKTIFTKYSVF